MGIKNTTYYRIRICSDLSGFLNLSLYGCTVFFHSIYRCGKGIHHHGEKRILFRNKGTFDGWYFKNILVPCLQHDLGFGLGIVTLIKTAISLSFCQLQNPSDKFVIAIIFYIERWNIHAIYRVYPRGQRNRRPEEGIPCISHCFY